MPLVRNVLVTGASRGLGLAIVRSLLAEGVSVIGLSRKTSAELESLVDNHANQFRFVPLDLNDPEQLSAERFQDEICQQQPLHGLVNNAAFAYDDLIT
ncbi:MAG: SDR family NAD(P)-dependent oxidoreductase, partial [Pirellulales bacterium]